MRLIACSTVETRKSAVTTTNRSVTPDRRAACSAKPVTARRTLPPTSPGSSTRVSHRSKASSQLSNAGNCATTARAMVASGTRPRIVVKARLAAVVGRSTPSSRERARARNPFIAAAITTGAALERTGRASSEAIIARLPCVMPAPFRATVLQTGAFARIVGGSTPPSFRPETDRDPRAFRPARHRRPRRRLLLVPRRGVPRPRRRARGRVRLRRRARRAADLRGGLRRPHRPRRGRARVASIPR